MVRVWLLRPKDWFQMSTSFVVVLVRTFLLELCVCLTLVMKIFSLEDLSQAFGDK